MQATLDLPLPKTSLDGSASTKDTLSGHSSPLWWVTIPISYRPKSAAGSGQTRVWLMDQTDVHVGASWMPNFLTWPNDARVCSLFSVLQTEPTPRKYYLSPKACAGIIRRAERRGKALPEPLRLALQRVADSGPTSTSQED